MSVLPERLAAKASAGSNTPVANNGPGKASPQIPSGSTTSGTTAKTTIAASAKSRSFPGPDPGPDHTRSPNRSNVYASGCASCTYCG